VKRYVAEARFGYDVNYDEFLAHAFKLTKGQDNYLYTKQLMMELYETHYGIHDHRDSTNPLASVQYNKCENYIDHYLFESYLEVFLYKGVHKYTGLNFDDFLDRPRYEIEKILHVLEGFRKKESSITDDAIGKLQKETK
jgi:hypothetical protein